MAPRLGFALVTAALLVQGPCVIAQEFPDKLVHIVIPFALGGSSDVTGRVLLPHLIERWKQQVIIDPRPGAASTVGTDHVAKSAPDGHTLLFTSTQFAYAPSTFKHLPYDPLNDLVPVTLVTVSPQMIIAHPSLPANNPQELVALARKHPGKLDLGNAGNVLPSHLFFSLAKVKITPVPYKGAGPLLTDVMGGHVPLAMAAISSLKATVRSGHAKVIGICDTKPTPLYPSAQPIGRVVHGFQAIAWFGMFAPRGTPARVVKRIHHDIAEVLKIPDVRERLLEIGGEPVGLPPDEFARFAKSEIEKWNKVAAQVGSKPN
jgi:tripartite-type tricarboxylate transporter receptor subunit TctC